MFGRIKARFESQQDFHEWVAFVVATGMMVLTLVTLFVTFALVIW